MMAEIYMVRAESWPQDGGWVGTVWAGQSLAEGKKAFYRAVEQGRAQEEWRRLDNEFHLYALTLDTFAYDGVGYDGLLTELLVWLGISNKVYEKAALAARDTKGEKVG
jgi:hypothetical protein